MDTTVTLGRNVTCTATGFAGVATAQTEYLGRPNRLVLVEHKAPDGSLKAEWIDGGRLTYTPDK